MTRWARGNTKREHEASSWDELKGNTDNKKKKGNNPDNKRIGENKGRPIPDWLEKRREARRNRRKKEKPCFHCRQPGHLVSECPAKDEDNVGNICFKCGSMEHMAHECKIIVKEGEYPFAKCFICKENGHLSSKCPDNPRGLYPDGGGCKFCGSVEHYRRDCPERGGKKEGEPVRKHSFKVRDENMSIEAIDEEEDIEDTRVLDNVKKKHKVVKF